MAIKLRLPARRWDGERPDATNEGELVTQTVGGPKLEEPTGSLGPVREHVIADARLCTPSGGRVAAARVTVRQIDSIAGWVGVVDADLTDYAEQTLVLHAAAAESPCVVVFTGGTSLLRGAGDAPRHSLHQA